jgi:enoyl-CoA hydratase/carnithine racemase
VSAAVRYQRRGPAVWLVIDREPARNALSQQVVAELREGLTRGLGEDGVRAIVVRGAGDRAFSAGADLKERRGMSEAETRSYLSDLGALMDALAAVPLPVVAAINGFALGGGTELALACDLRVAAEAAELGLTEVRLGIIPGAGGTQRLARLVGVARAKELVLLGRRLPARAALAIGLVSQVVAPADLDAAVGTLCEELEACAPLAVARAKEAIDRGWELPLGEALRLERALYETLLQTTDRQEGLRAFADKRRPDFRGR